MKHPVFKAALLLWGAILSSQSLFSQPTSFTSRGVGGGGAMFSMAINPANDNEYFASCDMGELFHTTDFGANYTQVDHRQIWGGHASKVCFTSTPGLMYTISYAADMQRPMKSTDGGTTWTALPGNPNNYEELYSIDADFDNPNRIVISWYNRIYFSSNGGTSFTSIHTAATGNGIVVGGVFFDDNNIYIGTNNGVLVSTNGGANWSIAALTGIPASDRIWSFAGAKVGGVTRFFCITGANSDIYAGMPGSDYWGFPTGVYSLDYGSGNWTPKMTGINVATDFPMFVGMAKNDINTVYLCGSNSNSRPTVFKTTNAGTNWSNTFLTTNNQNITTGWSGHGGDRPWSYGECPFGMAVSPNNANKVIFGDYGFIHKTSNGGTSWQQAYVATPTQNPAGVATPQFHAYQSNGLENTTSWQMHWTSANKIWSCFSDIKGIKSDDGGLSWSFNYTGHNANTSYRIVEHPTNGNLFMATSSIHDMYQSTRLADEILDQNDSEGKIVYSTNQGQTWQNLHVFGHPVFWIALDPNNPNIAYASVIHYNGGSGVGGIYKTTNLNLLASSTWTLLPNPPRTQKHPACINVLNDGTVVASFSGRRTDDGFQNSSGVFVYNGSSWTDVSHPGMHYWTKDVVIDPNDTAQNTWYVCVFSGWGGAPNGLGGLYKTTNRGTSWTKLTGTTIDRVASITFNPANANQIYLTTEGQGLWMCSNLNNTTPTFSQVDSYPFQQPERVFFNPYNSNELWVTSFGNGMKVGSLAPLSTNENKPQDNRIALYPNPASGWVKVTTGAEVLVNIKIYNLAGLLVGEFSEAEFSVENLSSGIYLVAVKTDHGIYNRKLIME
ncbi:T9SS type A sorting domain-containing protein [Flavobacterium sp.]|uniref:T9SS type A sorting domain-containing protein n=1 Tax=Flavobacterium sp. TaxID=239 RepID=UPI0039E2F12F